MFFPKKMVGIDIGTSAIKVVEISRWGQGKTLENYGQINSEHVAKSTVSSLQKGASFFASDVTANAIKAILQEARIRTKAAIFSIPDFSTFCTSFEIPPMTEKEIPGAIRYNASQYITLPIDEVVLDWHVLPTAPGNTEAPLKVFLVAIPNQVIQEYQTIAKMAGLELYALEAEMLGITRALVKNDKKTVCIMDIGVQSSTINIIDKGFLKRSYSFNFNSSQLSKAAEVSPETLSLLIDPLLVELRSVAAEFLQVEQKDIEEIYLTGGTANVPGVKEYFAENFKKPVLVPNCFSDMLYPPVLENNLKEMSPRFCAAIGVALGGLEMK